MVSPTSFVYGNSVDASRFVQLEEMECNFQPLNLTFQVESVDEGFCPFVHAPLIWSRHCFSPSDVVPGHKQGAQQASGLHCGYQDPQPAVWQRSRHVPHHWNTGECQQQPVCIIHVARIVLYYLIHLPTAAAAFSSEAFGLWTSPTKIPSSPLFFTVAIATCLARGSAQQEKSVDVVTEASWASHFVS